MIFEDQASFIKYIHDDLIKFIEIYSKQYNNDMTDEIMDFALTYYEMNKSKSNVADFKSLIHENYDQIIDEELPEKLEYDDSFKMYLKEISQYKLLTSEQYEEYFKDLEHHRTDIINANYRLVISIAKRYARRGSELMDLIQEGNLGLMKAVERYDLSKGYRFSTYATWWIRQSVVRSIADSGRIIRLPVHINEKVNKIKLIETKLTMQLGRDPEPQEIIDCYNEMNKDNKNMPPINFETFKEYQSYSNEILCLDQPVGDEDDALLGDFIDSEAVMTPEMQYSKTFIKESVQYALDSLPYRDRLVLEYRFGFRGRMYTLEEVGDMFHLTRERIRQIEKNAIRKIKHKEKIKALKPYADI